MVQTYRLKAVQHFPFVVPPPSATLESLRRHHPFLLLGMLSAMTVHDCSIQRQLGEEVRLQIYNRIMLGFEKSEDLLQGLLVHLAFYQYHLRPQRQQMLLITQLCVNLVYDLGLDDLRGFGRELQKEVPQSGVDICNRATEARLLLGTYYLAAV